MSDLISRCELFNRLATIPAPVEANEFKAKIYEIIQSMETADVAYICDREKCERCDPRCDLTRDKEHAATTEKAVLLDGISRPQGEWIDAEIPLESGGTLPIQACNLCKTFYPLAYTGGGHRFCPNCGARMKGADDEV